jgi:CBS domain-containing protein
VVDAEGLLEGIVSLNDLVQVADEVRPGERPRVSAPKFVHTLQAICAHPDAPSPAAKKSELATAPR